MVDISHMVDIDLPCLKILHLSRVHFGCHEHVMKLLSGCPILEVSTCITQLPMFQSLTYLQLNFTDQD